MAHVATFDDWTDLFHSWLDDIGVDDPAVRSYRFEAKYGQPASGEIQFGGYAGRPKWEKAVQIPDQRIADALLNLIVYQADTEFASVEQQRHLFQTAPTEFDRQAFVRVMTEEARHGWQMSHILVTQFGSSGRVEAEKLLQRRSFKRERLLGSFNIDIETWTDFFVFTQFIDRDGKFQLNMLSTSAFAPLARSMGPMLHEESFHLGTGTTGLTRIVQAHQLPLEV
ncbi:MAG: phenylacetate-CoA oxygenase subunit PaaI, partial [Chloroflexota bacterium]|nr:phenylacetate-CoA oxygenase subunit PaaI [Chloroflexota bacterium]